jgi:transposase
VINQIRGLLLEHGITVAVGPAHLKRQIPSILEDADNLLSSRMRALLVELRDEWEKLETQIEKIDREFAQAARTADVCSPSLESDPSRRLRSPQPSETVKPFTKAVIWQLGSVWSRASIRQVANHDFSASANAAILI